MDASGDTEQERAPLSPAHRQQLEDELTRLREQRGDLATSIGAGGPSGDSADRAGALERAEELEWVDRRIAEVSDVLVHGEAPAAGGANPVPVGTVVTLQYPEGEREMLRVSGAAEDDAEATLTPDSPLGKALSGRQPGDTVTYDTPSGQVQVRVLDVRLPGGSHSRH